MISIFVDADNNLLSLCNDDLSGCTGWQRVANKAITSHTNKSIDEMFNHLANSKGVPLYKFVNGYVEPRTDEEIAVDEAAIPVIDTVSSEDALAEIMEVLNNDTERT